MDAIFAEKSMVELTLKAAIIYDDFDFAARTAALLQGAAVRADEALHWDLRPWRLDLLTSSSLAAAAHDETVDADLIVVALCKTHLLRDEVLGWLEHWASHRRVGDAAILVLCPEETAGPMSSWNRLKEFAEWRELLFLGGHHLRNDGKPADFVHRLWQRRQPGTPELRWSADPARAPRLSDLNE